MEDRCARGTGEGKETGIVRDSGTRLFLGEDQRAQGLGRSETPGELHTLDGAAPVGLGGEVVGRMTGAANGSALRRVTVPRDSGRS